MEAVFSAAIGAGLTDDAFWHSTPYEVSLRLKAIGKARREAYLLTGWMAERFAREERLSGPQHYMRQFFEPNAAEQDAEALADAEFARIARTYGIEIVDLEAE